MNQSVSTALSPGRRMREVRAESNFVPVTAAATEVTAA